MIHNLHNYLKDPNYKVKCYLECLNECTNSFEVVKEFYIHDGQFTTIIDYKNDLVHIN